jgi:Ca2+-binding EF-hand superfamily protein
MELELSENQTDELFDQLDKNKDGFVNYQDWSHTIRDDN